MLPSFGGLKRLYLRHFAKPAHDQSLFRHVHRQPIRRLVHLGIGTLERTLKLIEAAEADNGGRKVELAGVDKFELRTTADGAGLSLKDAHRLLIHKGIKARLLPGDPLAVLASAANSLSGTDLLLVGVDQDRELMSRAWFYVPRMLSPDAAVFIEEAQSKAGEFVWRQIPPHELARLAQRPRSRQAA